MSWWKRRGNQVPTNRTMLAPAGMTVADVIEIVRDLYPEARVWSAGNDVYIEHAGVDGGIRQHVRTQEGK